VIPTAYQDVLNTVRRTGDFKDGVLKVNIPRNDLRVTIKQRSAPTPFGFGEWIALTKGEAGQEVMMGDLVLTEDEVNSVMSALLDNGLDVTALRRRDCGIRPGLFLEKAGISCALYETHSYVEGGLALAPNGMKVLAAFGIADHLRERATAISTYAFRNDRGALLEHARIDPAVNRQPMVAMSRALTN
jgi:hypothetical protein